MAVETEPIKKQLFTVKETAAILSVSINVVYELIKKGDLRSLKLPGHRVPDFEIERFKHWVYENEVDYSDILKKEVKTDDKKVQKRSNITHLGNSVDSYS
ncbi:MAG: helix-turn-helix domain-containing protein [Alkalibacterium sp.]|nr:helix-turn-helix domain-containing protein [Alkalibacterium sp.]